MTRTTTGLCIAAALGFAVSVGAQSPTSTTADPSQRTGSPTSSSSSKEISVTGCLARGADGTYMLNNARTGDNMSSATTTTNPTTAGGSTTTATGTTGTSGSSSAGTTAAEPSSHAGAAKTWKLEGGKDLDRHVGHEIQVTGRSDMSGSSSTATAGAPTTTAPGATTTAGSRSSSMNEPRLEVSSVKMISSTCR